MDIVITYVDGRDSAWLADYAHYTEEPIETKRFRDWDTLPFLMRGIEKNMPFVENVFLVVARESQVPSWVNRDRVKVVLHKDFIPEEFLPTFNCNPIEIFLHRIPGLNERFLYFNDDMFPMLPSREEEFFPAPGSIRIGFSRHILKLGMFKQICANSDALAREALGLKASCVFVRPQHICTPMLKSASEEVFSRVEAKLNSSITRIREAGNYNQYLFLDYLYYKGRVCRGSISKKHFSVAATSADKLCRFLTRPTRKFCCINDVHLSDAHFENMRRMVLSAFSSLYPEKSVYEH